jgi:hypothetical protein
MSILQRTNGHPAKLEHGMPYSPKHLTNLPGSTLNKLDREPGVDGFDTGT